MKRDLVRIAVIVLGISLAGITAASAYRAPTAAEIAACAPDAFRFCLSKTRLNRAAIFTCMRVNKRRLSPDCRSVFAKHGY